MILTCAVMSFLYTANRNLFYKGIYAWGNYIIMRYIAGLYTTIELITYVFHTILTGLALLAMISRQECASLSILHILYITSGSITML